ncbi:MAG: class F sortase [Lactobacillales bacterium]|nr:class F sortase [Lactobacillales bacterium]
MKNRGVIAIITFVLGLSIGIGGATVYYHQVEADNLVKTKTTETKTKTTKTSKSEKKVKTKSSTSTGTSASTTTSSTVPASVPKQRVVQNEQAVNVATKPTGTSTDQKPAAVAQTTPTVSPVRYRPSQLNILNDVIPYEDGGQAQGQAIINSDPDGLASTWGGANPFSGTDGLNTHIIGHNPGAFYILYQLAVGDNFVVTDSSGTPFTYQVTQMTYVNHEGVDLSTNQDLWDQITGTGGGERVTLQTCNGADEDLIVFSEKVD